MPVSSGFQSSQQMPNVRQMPQYRSQSGTPHTNGIYAADSNKMNKYAMGSAIAAVVGLFISFCGGIFALVVVIPSFFMAYAGFVQIQRSRQRGREFVIAAVVINVVSTIIILSSTMLFFAFVGRNTGAGIQ